VALDLLAEEGIEALSLRRLARRAGVSHSAPLRHFRSFSQLKSEVAARGFRLLAEGVEKSAASLPPSAGPLDRLREAGVAYVRMAVANPGLFALMFRPEDLDVADEHFERESRAAFDQLRAHVQAAQDEGWQPERDTRLLAGVVWAQVHGLAALWSQGAFSGAIPGASLAEAIALCVDSSIPSAGGSRP